LGWPAHVATVVVVEIDPGDPEGNGRGSIRGIHRPGWKGGRLDARRLAGEEMGELRGWRRRRRRRRTTNKEDATRCCIDDPSWSNSCPPQRSGVAHIFGRHPEED